MQLDTKRKWPIWTSLPSPKEFRNQKFNFSIAVDLPSSRKIWLRSAQRSWRYCEQKRKLNNKDDRDAMLSLASLSRCWYHVVHVICAFCSAYISSKDAESGLKSIAVSIYDITLKLTVWNATRPALTLQPDDSREKRVSSGCVLSATRMSVLSDDRQLPLLTWWIKIHIMNSSDSQLYLL